MNCIWNSQNSKVPCTVQHVPHLVRCMSECTSENSNNCIQSDIYQNAASHLAYMPHSDEILIVLGIELVLIQKKTEQKCKGM